MAESLLSDKSRVFKLVKLVREVGIEPVRYLLYKSKMVRELNLPISQGMMLES